MTEAINEKYWKNFIEGVSKNNFLEMKVIVSSSAPMQ